VIDMKKTILLISILFINIVVGCDKNEKITRLLKSTDLNEVIEGAFLAGKSKNEKHVPLLLLNANDWRTSTSFRFKGFSVYEEKMYALEQIYNISPPKPIKSMPDSLIINFYDSIYKSRLK